MADALTLYNDFYQRSKHPPLYAAPWWLNATCGMHGWDVLPGNVVDGNIESLLPVCRTKIRGMNAIVTPPMTQWLPILSRDESDFNSFADFIHSIPKCPIVDITLKPTVHVSPESQSVQIQFKYSYILPYKENDLHFKSRYNENLKRNLRDAEKKYRIEISNDMAAFLSLCRSSYQIRKMNEPAWIGKIAPAVILSLWEHNAGRITFAYYEDEPIAGILAGWDLNTTYYLLGGRLNTTEGDSAHAILLDHAIGEAQQRGHDFDFEGSMQSGIANFFQSFGAIPEPYWHIRRFRGLGKLWAMLH
jgi:hypothetical protein